MKTTEH